VRKRTEKYHRPEYATRRKKDGNTNGNDGNTNGNVSDAIGNLIALSTLRGTILIEVGRVHFGE
jgi:hypothetical protein